MSGNDGFEVEGRIVEVRPNKTFEVELANGHRLLGFVTGRARMNTGRWVVGDKVRLAMSPYDLSQGRIIVETQKV